MSKSLRFSWAVAAWVAIGWSLSLTRPASGQIAAYLPDETASHEGTWLQWPHHFTYGTSFRNQIEPTWIEMTRVLVQSERVHIIAYNTTERTRISQRLTSSGVSLANVDFVIRATDDCWVRDNGPLFVRTLGGSQVISDWAFNGWGEDAPWYRDDTVPAGVAAARGFHRWDVNEIVLEGGAIEVDGGGVLMATRSSILEPMRNPGLTQAELEAYLTEVFGVVKFIWLDGAPGGWSDITDMHIDGFARFGMSGKLVTMSQSDLAYWGLAAVDIQRLYAARDIRNVPYQRVVLPLTRNSVVTTSGYNLGYKGSYVNFYVANRHVLMPTYNDPNDAAARQILQAAFPGRTVVGVDVRNLYRWGGMIHCVTQQQPRNW